MAGHVPPWGQPGLRLHEFVPGWQEGAGLPQSLHHPSGPPALRSRVSATLQPCGSDSSNSHHQPLQHVATLALDLGGTRTRLCLTLSTTERDFLADWHQCQKTNLFSLLKCPEVEQRAQSSVPLHEAVSG